MRKCPATKFGLASYRGRTPPGGSVRPSSLTWVLSGMLSPETPASKLWLAKTVPPYTAPIAR
ncbi:hypothetical protein [Candidatus Nitrososphaera sp. FF02]|uniref:hypothetical protein n=1 Tax=Candidatus Nitrososphaera sp. FF02 TaxID=3398226 RepID=UPI0039EC72FF